MTFFTQTLNDIQRLKIFIQGTIEEKIYQRQITKQGLSGTVADASASSKVEFSREDLKVIMYDNYV